MSYQSDRKRMEQSAARNRELWAFVIRVTVIVLAAAFLALGVCALIFELPADRESPDSGNKGEVPAVSANDKVTDGYIYAVFGESISYKKYVSYSGGELSVDYSAVDTTKEGVYPVTYTVTSPSGKTASVTLQLVLKRETYTVDALNALLEEHIIPKLNITSGLSVQQKVRKIYSYVNSPEVSNKNNANIVFTNESNIPQINRSNWMTDWVEEAYRTVESGEGDCYSYYSLSKALFEYYGIENVGIRRDDAKSNESGNHFWQVVNIGTSAAPRWYFYDSTRLAGEFADGTNQACLLTEAELNSYVSSKDGSYGFYAYDKSALPNGLKIATEQLP